ncbi:MAG: glycosyltransferase [Bacteroidetes bacterium]|nr:glycosyltransferase [Bacteroidota bacterium]
MSLPYFRNFGWDAEIVTVDPLYSEMVKDELLLQSIPGDIKIHQVKAFDKKWTSKLGLGSLALRSLWFYKKAVNRLLSVKKFDLIYFSTTAFPVCILGNYWKNKFNIPYVIDMQDPWHSEYYRDKPKDQQPPKYWFSYRLNKYLEPIAMKRVDGLIAVSNKYITDLKNRYKAIKDVPSTMIPFGAFSPDMDIARQNHSNFKNLLEPGYTNVVYIGRGGADMRKATSMLFEAIKNGIANEPEIFKTLRFYFIGTSYAPAGRGKETIMPLAKQFGIENNVIELTDRISFYHALATLQDADALFIPGSDSPGYSASKIYPYLVTQKPLIAIFNRDSNIVNTIRECTSGVNLHTFPDDDAQAKPVYATLRDWGVKSLQPITLKDGFDHYSAKNLTRLQTELFAKAINYFEGGIA